MIIVSREEMKKTRLNFVHQMHDYIKNLNSDGLYEAWIYYNYLPFTPTDQDFEAFTEPHLFASMCKIFGKLVVDDEKINS